MGGGGSCVKLCKRRYHIDADVASVWRSSGPQGVTGTLPCPQPIWARIAAGSLVVVTNTRDDNDHISAHIRCVAVYPPTGWGVWQQGYPTSYLPESTVVIPYRRRHRLCETGACARVPMTVLGVDPAPSALRFGAAPARSCGPACAIPSRYGVDWPRHRLPRHEEQRRSRSWLPLDHPAEAGAGRGAARWTFGHLHAPRRSEQTAT